MRLREKFEIADYDEKAAFLKENGWVTYYHDDNWIMTEWFTNGTRYEYAGISTDRAYYSIKKINETKTNN